MNLSDLSYDELMKIKEVGLFVRDVAYRILPHRSISSADEVLYRTEDYEILIISNSIILQKNENTLAWLTNPSLAVTFSELDKGVPYSTSFRSYNKRYLIRWSIENKILVANKPNISFNNITITDESYIEVLNEYDTFEEMQGEIFQKSLVLNSDEMNVALLNYLFRKELQYSQSDEEFIFTGHTDEVGVMLKVHESLEDLRKYVNM